MGHRHMSSAVIVGRETRETSVGLKRAVDANLVACWWWFMFKNWLQKKLERVGRASSGAVKHEVKNEDRDTDSASNGRRRNKEGKIRQQKQK